MVRYAIYFAPPPESALWRAGTAWLGADPESGRVLDTPAVAGYTSTRLAQLCAAARRYGFHATVKAPFRLAPGLTEADVLAALASFCAMRESLPLPLMRLATLDGFIALVPRRDSAALADLALACVQALDPLRAPPDAAELCRRRAHGLSSRQEENLQRYGYPYVGEDFRFHFTLTDRLDPADRDGLLATLQSLFKEPLAETLRMDALALFAEPAPGAPFRLLRRVAFGAGGRPGAHL